MSTETVVALTMPRAAELMQCAAVNTVRAPIAVAEQMWPLYKYKNEAFHSLGIAGRPPKISGVPPGLSGATITISVAETAAENTAPTTHSANTLPVGPKFIVVLCYFSPNHQLPLEQHLGLIWRAP